VNVFAWVEGNTVHVESKFPGGRKVKNGQVVVLDADDHKLLDGRTDKQGMFSFKVPERKDLKIVLNAGMGHRAEWTIKAEEFLGQEAAEPPTTPAAASQKGPTVNQGLSEDRKQREISPGLDTLEIQKLVEQSLDKKLAPVLRMLEANRDRGPSTTEVIGGIGYIFGLIGVAAYVSSRRRQSQ
jgi:nickel transport protein